MFMAYGKKQGIGAVFWVTFIIFGLLVLIGIFYWMLAKPNPVRHSPERPSGAIFVLPLQSAVPATMFLPQFDNAGPPETNSGL